jgi:hypothetical protein
MASRVMEYKKVVLIFMIKFLMIDAVFFNASVEDDIQTIAFANSHDPDPMQYLILQRAVPEDVDPYYFEVNSREISGEGGFSKAILTPSKLEIDFSTELQRRYKFLGICINFKNIDPCGNKEFNIAINNIFKSSDCSFTSTLL